MNLNNRSDRLAVGDYDFSGTFLPKDNAYGISSNTSYYIRDDGKVKVSYNQGGLCKILIIEPFRRSDLNGLSSNSYNCRFIIYDTNHTVSFHDGEPDFAYKQDIVVDIDPSLLLHDEHYFKYLMEVVLKKSRVDKYLSEGVKVNSSSPCGNYVGGACYNDDGTLIKFFKPSVGKHIHMVYNEQRVNHADNSEKLHKFISDNQQIDRRIKELQDEIAQLLLKKAANQSVIDEMMSQGLGSSLPKTR